MDLRIAVLNGDGIGPEIIKEALLALKVIGDKYGHRLSCQHHLIGGEAIDRTGNPLPPATLQGCLDADAVLLGAVGGPKWDKTEGHERPEGGLLALRASMKLYANLRPVYLLPSMIAACPLKEALATRGIDMMIVRELTGGMYFGDRGRRHTPQGTEAYDTERYNEAEITRVARVAFAFAGQRGGLVTSIDKANVLSSSRLWRDTVSTLALDYPHLRLEHMLVDNAAMQLIRDPSRFDVILTNNIFGDILSDEAAVLTGSIGCLPSASLGDSPRGLYEPIHGSAPDIAGKNSANPIGTILSVALMLRHSFLLEQEATALSEAVARVLAGGYRTADIMQQNCQQVSTSQMGALIAAAIQ